MLPLAAVLFGCAASTAGSAQDDPEMRLGQQVTSGFKQILRPGGAVLVTIDPVLDEVSSLAVELLDSAEKSRFSALEKFLKELSRSLRRNAHERSEIAVESQRRLRGAVQVGLRLLNEESTRFESDYPRGVKQEYENVIGYKRAMPLFTSSWDMRDPYVDWEVARPVGFYARSEEQSLPRLYRCVVYLRHVNNLETKPALLKALTTAVASSERVDRARRSLAVMESCMARLWGECDKLGFASVDRASAFLGSRKQRNDKLFLSCSDQEFLEKFGKKPQGDTLGRLPYLFQRGLGCDPENVLEATGTAYRSRFLGTLIGLSSCGSSTALGPAVGSRSWTRRQLVAAAHAYLTLRWYEALSAAGGPTTGRRPKPQSPRLFVEPCGKAYADCARAVRALGDTMRFLEQEKRRGTGPFVARLQSMRKTADALTNLLESLDTAVKVQERGDDVPGDAARSIRDFVESWTPTTRPSEFGIRVASDRELRAGPWRYFEVPLIVDGGTVKAWGVTSTVEARRRLEDRRWSPWREVPFASERGGERLPTTKR